MEFSKLNERTRYLSYDQGSCARNIPEDLFKPKLTPPPPLGIHIR